MIRRFIFFASIAFTLGVSGVIQAAVTDNGLTARWLFDTAHIQGSTIKDTAGQHDLTLSGPAKQLPDFEPGALLLNGDINSVTGTYDPQSFPQQSMTVESWINVERTVEWGTIIAVGENDKGWLLGSRQSNWSFGVGTKDSEGKEHGVPHTRALTSLQWGHWYHVVGTFDGKTQKLYINGELAASRDVPEGAIAYPANGEMTVGYQGPFHYQCWLHEIRIYNRPLTDAEVQGNFQAKQALFPAPLEFDLPPTLARMDNETVEIQWQTKVPCASTLRFGTTPPLTTVYQDQTPKTEHSMTVQGLAYNKIHYYTITGNDTEDEVRTSRMFEYDSTFNYTSTPVHLKESPYPKDEWTETYEHAAEKALSLVQTKLGYCLVLGCGEGRLMYELAKRSELKLIGVDDNPENVAKARHLLDRAGIYGIQATVHEVPLDTLPLATYHANLIVSDSLLVKGELPGNSSEAFRVLRPCGGVVVLGHAARSVTKDQFETWLKPGLPDATIETGPNDDTMWAVYERGKLPGSGEWSHQYGNPTQSSCNDDSYLADDMGVLWFGEPGPRPMVDRGTRPPGPLSVNGRLYVQGDRKIFGMDAYNGTLLWTLEIPDLRRANIPRDNSNTAADDDCLYAAIKDSCWMLDGQTGKRLAAFKVTGGHEEPIYDWGFVARIDDLLVGSGVRQGGIYIGADGEWYDESNEQSFKVISDFLFAQDREHGKRLWTYRGGAIINSTLAYGEGNWHFIECRNPEVLAAKKGRAGREVAKDTYLVSINGRTGEKNYERPIDFNEGWWVMYLSYSQGMLVGISTTDQYHIYGIDAKNGKEVWQHTYKMAKDNHGGGMQHPAIVGNIIYAEPESFLLQDGQPRDVKLPERRGCGGVTAAMNFVIGRHNYTSFLNLEKNTRVEWLSVRPGCWLGVIPAGGLILAPESSAGCHCNLPIQLSMGLIAKANRGPKEVQ